MPPFPIPVRDAVIRLFTGIALPEPLARRVDLLKGGIPGARWIAPENYHVTLTFIGDVDEATAEEVDAALSSLREQAFMLEISGTGSFSQGEDAKVLWLGVRPDPALLHLQQKSDRAVLSAGVKVDTRKYIPHLTLARFRHAPDPQRLGDFMQAHNLFSLPPFPVRDFVLYESHIGKSGAAYTALKTYPLLEA